MQFLRCTPGKSTAYVQGQTCSHEIRLRGMRTGGYGGGASLQTLTHWLVSIQKWPFSIPLTAGCQSGGFLDRAEDCSCLLWKVIRAHEILWWTEEEILPVIESRQNTAAKLVEPQGHRLGTAIRGRFPPIQLTKRWPLNRLGRANHCEAITSHPSPPLVHSEGPTV